MLRVGLISDTHGLLRPEAKAFLQGSDLIVHAGDICDPKISDELAAIAPVDDRNGVLYVNPGNSGPRRFKLPVAVGELIVTGRSGSARIVDLSVENGAAAHVKRWPSCPK